MLDFKDSKTKGIEECIYRRYEGMTVHEAKLIERMERLFFVPLLFNECIKLARSCYVCIIYIITQIAHSNLFVFEEPHVLGTPNLYNDMFYVCRL